jgi:hypothetical protein
VAVLDVKLVEQGKREDARSYSSFVGEIERLRYAMPTAPSSAS